MSFFKKLLFVVFVLSKGFSSLPFRGDEVLNMPKGFFEDICMLVQRDDIKNLGDTMVCKREELNTLNSWNIEKMYPSWNSWYQKLDEIKNKGEKWNKLFAYKGLLNQSPTNLKNTLENYFSIGRNLENLLVFAHLSLDQDLANDRSKEAYGLISTIFFDFREKSSWIEPEILQMPEDILQEYVSDPSLKDYSFYLEKLLRLKPYTLNIREEEILARASQTLQTPYKTFSSFNNADISFEEIKDSKGNKYELSHGRYILFLRSEDRVLRKTAFDNLHKKFLDFENTLCELIQGQIKNHVFLAKTRGFKNCLEAALYPDNIDVDVYHNLIKTVKENISVLHKFVAMKKKFLKIDDLYPYDLYAPIIKDVECNMSLEKAKAKVVDSVSILSKEYQEALKKGLFENRWVDAVETKRKRSGAYSSGCYDSMPYILMNFHGSLNDALTLAHEAGHSMHSFLSNKKQPYHLSDYSIFVAEVASTFNEQLLFDILFKEADKTKKAYLLSNKIDAIHATFFRQTLFAEFELELHKIVENGKPLTPGILKSIYRRLYSEYYGKELNLDKNIDIEWSRIPHFYYNYYVYQYATGLSAAIALFENIKKDNNNCNNYLEFLKSGGSDYPIELLKKAGVDLKKPEVIKSLINYFSDLIDQLEDVYKNE